MEEGLFKGKYRIKSARLSGWDYGTDVYYFVTICVYKRNHYFGRVMIDDGGDAFVALSEIGKIARDCWMEISKHFPFVILDAFIIMPNHVHGIIKIMGNDTHNNSDTHRVFPRRDVACNVSTVARPSDVHTQNASPSKSENACTVARTTDVDIKHASHNERKKWMGEISPKSGSIPTIIRSYKSAVTKICNQQNLDFKWQPRFHDSIIRDERALNGIRYYIKITNPEKWHRDRNNVENIWM